MQQISKDDGSQKEDEAQEIAKDDVSQKEDDTSSKTQGMTDGHVSKQEEKVKDAKQGKEQQGELTH